MADGRMLAGGANAPLPERPRVRVQFRPGTVGVTFAQTIPAARGDLTGFECDALRAFGLAIDADSGAVCGVPTLPSEHDVTIRVLRAAEPVDLDTTIIINADARSLWRAVDPPADAPHATPHHATLHLAGDLTIVGASKRGRSHANGGAFRENHFGARVARPWHLLAVADGAGSAALSRQGSRLAVETALDALKALLSAAPSGEESGSGKISRRPAFADRPHPTPFLKGRGLRVSSPTPPALPRRCPTRVPPPTRLTDAHSRPR